MTIRLTMSRDSFRGSQRQQEPLQLEKLFPFHPRDDIISFYPQ